MINLEKLAIFDVDFTITRRETLLEFYLFMIGKKPSLIFHAPFAFGSSLMFITNIMEAKKTKENFINFIDGMKEEYLTSLAEEFYSTHLKKILYRDALSEIRKLKSQGFKIYLISASPEFYLNTLYDIKEVDKIIGTVFIKSNGIYSNKIAGENCKGQEKVLRLKNHLEENNIKVDFKNSYMFSDSLSDLPLFNLVGHPYLINFKKKDSKNINILNWN